MGLVLQPCNLHGVPRYASMLLAALSQNTTTTRSRVLKGDGIEALSMRLGMVHLIKAFTSHPLPSPPPSSQFVHHVKKLSLRAIYLSILTAIFQMDLG